MDAILVEVDKTLVDGFGSRLTSGVASYAEEPCLSLVNTSRGVASLRFSKNVKLWSSFSKAILFGLLGSASAFAEGSLDSKTPALVVVLSTLEGYGLEWICIIRDKDSPTHISWAHSLFL